MARRPKQKKDLPSNTVIEPEVLPPEGASDRGAQEVADEADLIVVDDSIDDAIASLPLNDDDDDGEAESHARPLTPVRYDPLSAYLAEISKHASLDKEQEHEVAVQYYEHKDLEAAYKLVVSNLWLVVKIARDYERAARNLLDVIQEGNIGLMEAVKNFDPYRGVRFPSYAVWWIKAYILRFIIANWRMVKIGTTQAQRKLFFNLKKEKERLEREGFYPEPKLLAEKLNVRESDIVEMEQRLGSPDVSVSAPLSIDSDLDFLSTLPAPQLNAEDILQQKEIRELVNEAFQSFRETLSERDKAIFDERLLGDEKITLHDLAERFSLSKERVRQLESRIREKLKTYLTEKIGSTLDQTLTLEDGE